MNSNLPCEWTSHINLISKLNVIYKAQLETYDKYEITKNIT